MSRSRAFGHAVWDFVVGDDWRTALGVVAALGLTAILAATPLPAWWLPPLAVAALLAASLRREMRRVVVSIDRSESAARVETDPVAAPGKESVERPAE